MFGFSLTTANKRGTQPFSDLTVTTSANANAIARNSEEVVLDWLCAIQQVVTVAVVTVAKQRKQNLTALKESVDFILRSRW